MNIHADLIEAKKNGRKRLAILIDPDKVNEQSLSSLITSCVESEVDYLFVGGSLLTHGDLNACVLQIKKSCTIPVVIFPGSHQQIDENADALLLLSLISGRNPEYLIGQHITAAPRLKQAGIELIPTGYILIDSGNQTTVQYVSNTTPVPADKPDIAACTALAGEQLGLKVIFAEAGSGAKNPVDAATIKAIRAMITVPLIVGGGIRTIEKAIENCEAGADVIVIGNSVEKDQGLIQQFAKAIKAYR